MMNRHRRWTPWRKSCTLHLSQQPVETTNAGLEERATILPGTTLVGNGDWVKVSWLNRPALLSSKAEIRHITNQATKRPFFMLVGKYSVLLFSGVRDSPDPLHHTCANVLPPSAPAALLLQYAFPLMLRLQETMLTAPARVHGRSTTTICRVAHSCLQPVATHDPKERRRCNWCRASLAETIAETA